MSIASFSDLSLPSGPRFTGLSLVKDDDFVALTTIQEERRALFAPRQDVIERAKQDLETGCYDDSALDAKLESCLDAILADVLPNH